MVFVVDNDAVDADERGGGTGGGAVLVAALLVVTVLLTGGVGGGGGGVELDGLFEGVNTSYEVSLLDGRAGL